jgi:hypothetical protein
MALTLEDLKRIASEPTSAGLSKELLESIAGPQASARVEAVERSKSLRELGIEEGFPEAIVGTLSSEEGRARLDPGNSIMLALDGLKEAGKIGLNMAHPDPRVRHGQVMDVAQAGGGLALGGMFELGEQLTGARTTGKWLARRHPLQEGVRQMASGISKKFTDPDEFAADPLFGPTVAAGLIPSGGTGTLGTLARFGRAMDPVVAGLEGAQLAGKIARLTGKAARTTTEALTGLTSGAGAPTGMEAGRAGRVGERGEFLKTLDLAGEKTAFELGEDVSTGLRGKRDAAGKIKGDFITATNAEGLTVDIANLKASITGDLSKGGEGGLLSELGIGVNLEPHAGTILQREGGTSSRIKLDTPASFRAVDEGQFEEAVRELLESPDQISVEALDEIKMGIDGLPSSGRTARSKRVLRKIRELVRKELGPIKIQDGTTYDQAIEPIARFNKSIESIEKRIGRPDVEGAPGDVNEMLEGQALARAFDSGVPRRDRTAALQEIDEMLPDVPVRSQAAGLNFSEIIPSGLVGRKGARCVTCKKPQGFLWTEPSKLGSTPGI